MPLTSLQGNNMKKRNFLFSLFALNVLAGFTKSPRVLYISLAAITLLFLTACSYSGGPTLQKCSDVCNGLVAYYPFFGSATDESGNNHHGELHNVTFVEDREGNPERGAHFNGKSYISLPFFKNSNKNSSYSFVVIFKPDIIPDEPTEWPSFKVIGTTNYAPGIHYRKNMRINFEGWNGKIGMKVFGIKTSPGRYFQVVGVADVEKNHTIIYVNGIVKGSKNWEENAVALAARRFWNDYVVIGIGNPNDNLKPEALVGVIDEVRIYNRALSDAEIDTIFKGPTM